ncbi:hypothetical protein [Urechidicola croceus]|uniref:DUF3575 domain-containing protein n=1 Tax=Urechidicola croceus TaxID=1850246 RepID=A0A1D8PA10_9FLAO|nr:hypothetical protein [Urechidicola croceus]AOW21393.1 hypothetical protein LPB138_12205 [Urechidicola croceus]
MKKLKIIFIVVTIFFTSIISAQNTNEDIKETEPKHEIGFDVLGLVQNRKVKLSYNYLLNESNSIGSTLYLFPENKNFRNRNQYHETLGIDFNYRHYFSEKHTSGFYIEAFAKYGWGRVYNTDTAPLYDYDGDYHNIRVGIGIGYKHIFKNNIYIDANIRYSKSIYKTGDVRGLIPETDLTFNIIIGKRF